MAAFMQILVDLQRWVYGSIAEYLNAFSTTGDWFSLTTVLPLGMVFGAVHALTPGHGKTVLASYLVGSRLAAVRGLAVAGVLALTHVSSAVILALAASSLVTRTLGGVGRAPLLENLGRGLLATIGVWLLWHAWKGRGHPHG